MATAALVLLKWTISLAFVIAAIFAFIVLLNLGLSMTLVTLNQNVLSDIFALVQMYLPFNLSVLLLWVVSASVAFISYKLAVMSIAWINRVMAKF